MTFRSRQVSSSVGRPIGADKVSNGFKWLTRVGSNRFRAIRAVAPERSPTRKKAAIGFAERSNLDSEQCIAMPFKSGRSGNRSGPKEL
jgi:hypothetical protein